MHEVRCCVCGKLLGYGEGHICCENCLPKRYEEHSRKDRSNINVMTWEKKK